MHSDGETLGDFIHHASANHTELPQIDREKGKVKKAREAAGEVVPTTPKKGKRKAEGETETPASSAKKAKGRKKANDEDKNGGGSAGEEVKASEVNAEAGEIKTEPEEEVLS